MLRSVLRQLAVSADIDRYIGWYRQDRHLVVHYLDHLVEGINTHPLRRTAIVMTPVDNAPATDNLVAGGTCVVKEFILIRYRY